MSYSKRKISKHESEIDSPLDRTRAHHVRGNDYTLLYSHVCLTETYLYYRKVTIAMALIRNHHVAFMEMDQFWHLSASFQLSTSIFIGLPAFLLPFGVFLNIRGNLLRDDISLWFIQYDL